MSPSDISQSALAPAGPAASSIHGLWQLLFWTCTAVLILVLAAVAAAVVRARRRPGEPAADRTLARSVGAAVAATVAILLVFLVASVWTTPAAGSPPPRALTIEVIGHQWWWEIQYEDAVPSRRVTTANELHIPIGRPIVLKVTSRDVIHSFWVPNLQGKRDLIPGYTTAIWLQADRPGIYRGQCAEFCGLQHAHMAFEVVGESEAAFTAWLDTMRQPARPPAEPTPRRGRDLFMQSRCAGCHTVRGTEAAGQVAPDLTHLAARRTLAAGTMANTREHLARWIRDPQTAKPGNQMPPTALAADDIEALAAYLETLR